VYTQLYDTVELGGTELYIGTLPPLVLGGIIENQKSDFVIAIKLIVLY
jgi:hypothetical protein